MSYLKIGGGRPLYGTVRVQGAKNSVLPILAATLLSGGECVIHNCPRLSDVLASVRILEHLGCCAEWQGHTLCVNTAMMDGWSIPDELMRQMRSSVLFLGAIAARCGRATLSYPGGCELGPRPIDLHLRAMQTLGAKICEENGYICCDASALRGGEIQLSIPSVGATENAMLAACGCTGTTVLNNAAREPEIVDLQTFLCALGADVHGAGGSTIAIRGGRPLHGGEHTVISDRIAAVTYLSAAAACGGEVCVEGADYRALAPCLCALREAGCDVRSEKEKVILRRRERLRAISPVRTAPYPGFPTDAQALLMASLLQSCGTTVFVETMFQSRFRHVDEMTRLGARIRAEGRVAVVCGVPELRGAPLKADDLRGGAALAVAALSAGGESRLSMLHHIERGYENFSGCLASLGADIERVDE